jgi:hypothetical protein
MNSTLRVVSSLACDVLVVGGGAAGIGAAVAAGRAGARVLLLERYGFFGGLATAAQVGTVCGLYLRDSVAAEARLVAGGFVKEYAAGLRRAFGMEPLRLENGLWALPLPAPAFGSVADALLKACPSVTVILHAVAAGAQIEGPRVVEVSVLAWNQPLIIRPASIVDCTGEATVAGLAGVEVEGGSAEQAPSLVFSLDQVDTNLTQTGLLELRRELRHAVEAGILPAVCERLALVPGANRDGRMDLKLNLDCAGPDDPDWRRITSWEREARALILELERFLRANTQTCRNARLTSVAPQLGVRSGGRIVGRATLASKDVLSCHKHPCGVARGCWPMERWGQSTRPEMTFFEEGDYYEIPLDCLWAAKLDNLFGAGRCVSAESGAISSARVIGTALATGWAAGTAAAFRALNLPLTEAVESIRRTMNE